MARLTIARFPLWVVLTVLRMPRSPLDAETLIRMLFPLFKVWIRWVKIALKLQLPLMVARTDALMARVTVGNGCCLPRKWLMTLVVKRRELVVSLLPL